MNWKRAIPVGGNIGNGMVIGEFVCDRIFDISVTDEGYDFDVPKMTGLTYEELESYLSHKAGFGWHITKKKLYDRPLPLSHFARSCENSLYCESCAMWRYRGGCGNAALQINRPPQSWMYVEDPQHFQALPF
jgi:hypothetical protein